MIKDEIIKNLSTVITKLGINDIPVDLEKPQDPRFGDFATSIAMKLSKRLKKNPHHIAISIVSAMKKSDFIEKVEAVKPGYINFYISKYYLLKLVKNISENKIKYPSYYLGTNKKIMIEFAHPNTHKLFHIGHLRNISIGESLVRIFENVGNKVIRSNYQGDVGLHIAKTLWYLKTKTGSNKLETVKSGNLLAKIDLLGQAYAAGQTAYDEDENVKKQIIEINRQIYDSHGDVISLWEETRKWSLEYFENIYKRVYSRFDRCYFESEFAKQGVKICLDAEKKKILKRSDGALVFEGKQYGLDTRVFINSLGFPTYEGKELALAEKEISDFGQLDKIIHVVTPEQTSFFKVTFKVEELLNQENFKNKQYHLAYEWVKLKSGKMSSRTGNVIVADWLINQAKEKIEERFKCSSETAETLAIASVKYSFLKNSVFASIAFDLNESISLEGNSGPYLLYTYVRCRSVMDKAGQFTPVDSSAKYLIKTEEDDLIRKLVGFEEIVTESAMKFSPNLIANYLYDLAQKFNLFYQKNKILDDSEEVKNFRLTLTMAVSQVIKNGLYLLGIKTVEKM